MLIPAVLNQVEKKDLKETGEGEAGLSKYWEEDI